MNLPSLPAALCVRAVENYRTWLKEQGLSDKTIENYISDLRSWLKWLNDRPALLAPDLTNAAEQYLDDLAQGHPISTVNRRTAALRRFADCLAQKTNLGWDLDQQLFGGTPQRPSSWTQWTDRFSIALSQTGCSETELQNLVGDVSLFLSRFPQQDLEETLTKYEVARYLREMRQRGAGNADIQESNKALQKFATWATESGFFLQNPLGSFWKNLGQLTQFTKTEHQRVNKEKLSKLPTWRQWYLAYHRLPFTTALHMALLVVFASMLSVFAFQQFGRDVVSPLAYPSAPVRPNRQLSFQGRLTDSTGTPITTATNVGFTLHDAPSAGNQLWDSGTCSIDPDQDGIFSTALGDTCGSEIPENVFSELANVWLEIEVGGETLTPRQQISSVPYALNTETVQGFPVSLGGDINTIPVINALGQLIIGASNPSIIASSGAFLVQGESLTFATEAGGDITIQPGLGGTIEVIGETNITGDLSADGTITFSGLVDGLVRSSSGVLSGGALVDVTTEVTGLLPIANGGTNSTATPTAGGIAYGTGTAYAFTAAGASGECLISGGTGAPSFGSCASAVSGSIPWQVTNGTANLKNTTLDLLVGGNSTTSAKFAILNVNGSGPATASVSGNLIVMPRTGLGGNVGIGTTSPTQALSVNGIAKIGNFTEVYTTGHSILTNGFIKATGYNLRPPTVGDGGFTGFKSNDSGNTNISVWAGNAEVAVFDGYGNSTDTVLRLHGSTFNPTSGSTLKRYLEVSPTITRGAGHSGNVYGVYVDPAFVSDAGTGQFYSAYFGGGNVGIGDTTPASLFTVGSGDLFQVNSSGAIAAATGITSSGTITFSGLTNGLVRATSGVLSGGATVNLASEVTGTLPIANGGTNSTATPTAGGVAYGTGTAYAFTAAGSSGECLISGGTGAPAFGSCAGAVSGSIPWEVQNGAANLKNTTLDLLVGGTSSTSAKFAVLNVDSGTPTASVSAGAAGAAYLTATGTLNTTAGQNLRLGTSGTTYLIVRNDGALVQTVGGRTNLRIVDAGSGLNGNVSLGTNANATGNGAIAIGPASSAVNNLGIAIGAENTAGTSSTAIGRYIQSTGSNQHFFGANLSSSLGSSTIIGSGMGATSPLLGRPLAGSETGLIHNARVPQVIVKGLGSNPSTAWTASGTTVTATAHGLSAGDPIILTGSTNLTYTYVTSVADANTFSVSTAPDASGTGWRHYGNNNPFTITNGTDGTSLVTVTKTGSVGIGIGVSPTARLDVRGINAGTGIRVRSDYGTSFMSINALGRETFQITAGGTGTSALQWSDNAASPTWDTNLFRDSANVLRTNDSLTVDGALTAGGTITFSGFSANGGLLYTNGSGVLAQTAVGSSGECLLSAGGGSPTWGSCAGAVSGSIPWEVQNGAANLKNTTLDLLVGGTATTSADFAVLNVNGSGPATASVSGNLIVMPKTGLGGRLGVGTTSPLTPFHVYSNSAATGSLGLMEYYSSGSGLNANLTLRQVGTPGQNNGFILNLQHADGNAGTPGITGLNRGLGEITGQGYNGSSYETAAKIAFVNDNNVSGASDMPGRIGFYTTPDGSGTTAERMRIDSAGNVGIGTTANASARLDILGGGFRMDSNGGTSNVQFEIKHDTTAFRVQNFSGSTVMGASGTLILRGGTTGGLGSSPGGVEAFRIASNGDITINEDGGNQDLRIEGDTNANLFFVDASTDRVGIGTNTPGSRLTLRDTANSTTLGASNTLQLYGATTLGARTEIGFGYAGGTNVPAVIGYVAADGSSNTNGDLYFGTRSVTTDTAVTERMRIAANGNVGIGGDATPDSLFSVGSTSQFQVNSSGAIAAATGITSSGTITFSGFSANGGLLYTNGSGVLAQTAVGSSGECLLSAGGGSPTWGSCAGAVSGSIPWEVQNGAANLKNTTLDLLVGGTATTSADFAVLNVNGTGPATASVSGSLIVFPKTGAGGRVGIGTTSPSTNLHIAGKNAGLRINGFTTSTDVGELRIGGGDTQGRIRFWWEETNEETAQIEAIRYNGTLAGALNFYLQANDAMMGSTAFQLTGSTGVTGHATANFGTSNGAADVGVNIFNSGTAGGQEVIALRLANNQTHASSNPAIGLASINSNGTQYDFAKIVGLKTQTWGTGATPYGGIGFYTTNGSTSFIEAARFDSVGNFGLGSTSPSSKLQVEGFYGGNALARFNETGGNDILTASASGTTRFVIQNDGDVGIGIANPAVDLDVYSTIRASNSSTNYIQMSHDSFNPTLTWSGGNQLILASATPTGNSLDIMPGSDNLYRLGNSIRRWAAVYSSTFVGGTSGQFSVNSSGSIAAATGITSSGTITFSGFSNNGGLLYTNGSGVLAQTAVGSSGECLLSAGGGSPTWGSCSGAVSGSIPWEVQNGAANLKNTTLDLLVGGNSSSSAKFAVLNVNSGTPTASVSAGTAGAAYISATGTLGTTAGQNITLAPSGTARLTVANNGYVGVGDTTPNFTFTVDGGASNDFSMFRTNSTYGRVLIDNQHATGDSMLTFMRNQSSKWSVGSEGDTDNFVIKQGAGAFGTNDRVTITSAGLVGIGNTTPAARLDILHDVTSMPATILGANIDVNSTGAYAGGTASIYGLYSNVSATGISTAGTQNIYGGYFTASGENTGSGTSNAFGLYVNGSTGADNNYSAVFMNGNVGIGTSSPGAKLDIVNSANDDALTITANGTQTNPILRIFESDGSTENVRFYPAVADGAAATAYNFNTVNTLSTTGALLFRIQNNGTNKVSFDKDGIPYFSGLSDGLVRSTSGVLSGAGTVSLTTEVTGVLPIANGGTNASSVGSAGSIAYSTGSAYAFSAVGALGECLVSGNTGAPTWEACSTAVSGSIAWEVQNGAANLKNTSLDLLVGGNSTASAKFAVLNVNNGTPTASVSAGTAGAAYLTATGTLGTTAGQNLTLAPSGTARMTVRNDGTVGIGTATPETLLHLRSESAFTNIINRQLILQSETTGTPGVGIGSGIAFKNEYSSGTVNTVAHLDVISSQSFRSGEFAFSVSQGSNPVEAMRIDYLGRVGIGTATPNTKLEIVGSSAPVASVSSTLHSSYAALVANSDQSGRNITSLAGGSGRAGTSFGVANAGLMQLYSNNSPLALGTANAFDLTIGTNNAARMTILSGGNIGIGDTTPAALFTVGTADAFQVNAAGNVVTTGTITANTDETINGIDISSGTVSDVVNLTINAGGDLTIGSIGLNDVGTTNITSGASLVGAFDEFDNSASTTVQDVLDDLDAAISSAASGSFNAAGDTGTPQAIAPGNTFSILGGTNGIDTVASATDIITLNLDTTEIGTSTFGSGSGFTWTFDAGATDPTIAFGSNSLAFTAATNTFNGNLAIGNNTISGGTAAIDFTNFDVTSAGNVTIGGTLGVTGISTFTGNVNANGGFDVDDAFVIADGGVLTTSQAANFNGAADFNGDLSVADTNIAFDGASTTFTTTGALTITPGGAVLIGDGGDTLQINTSDWDISTTGDMTGIGAITSNGNFVTTGTITAATDETINGVDINAGAISDVTNLSASGTITFSGLSNGLVRSTSGVLSGAGTVSLTTEVTGILPIANGGTNSTATPTAGGIAYGTGTAYAFSAAGSAGQCLVSGGTGAPTWASCASAASNFWQLNNTHNLSASNLSYNILLGNTASSSANTILNADGSAVFNEQGLDRDFRVEGDTSTHLLFADASTDRIGIGLSSPATQLDILTTNNAAGGIRMQSSLDDATTKNARIKVGHYTNSEEPVTLLMANAGATTNTLYLGGGSGAENAATSIGFYTAANNTTTTGTQRMTISASGLVGIGDTTPASLLTVGDGDLFQVNSSGIISNIDGVAHTIDDVSGNLTLTSNSTTVSIADALSVTGAITATGTITAATDETINGVDISAGTVSDVVNLTINSGGDLTIGSIGLNDVGSSNITSGASLVGVYDEFDNSSSTTLQDVLDDLDAAITSASSGSFDVAGDSGSNQTIAPGNTLSILGGTNGIDTVASATDTLTLNLDTTEIGSTTFGSGSGFTWTFNAGATDPTIAFTSNAITFTAGTNTFAGNVAVGNNTISGGTATIDFTNFDVSSAGALTLASTITANTNETINGIDINAGAVSDITTLSTTSTVTFSTFTNNGGLLYTNGSGVLAQTSVGSNGQCLLSSGGGAPTWGSCATGTTNYWQLNNTHNLSASNLSYNILLGNTATSSANTILNADGSAVFNEQGGDHDFRIEGSSISNLFFVDASTDSIGIRNISPSRVLDVTGTGRFFGTTNAVQLEVRGSNGQSANIQEWVAFGGSTIASVSPSGLLTSVGLNSSGDITIGGTSETLANAGFALDGNDLFVAGMAGIEGNVYTDGSFVAGASTTYGNGTISQSSGETLTIGTTAAGLTLQTTTSGNIILNSSGTIELQDNTNITGNLDVSGTLTAGTGNAFQVDASGNLTTSGTIVAATNETINGIDISSGTISDVVNLTINGGGDLTIGSIGLNDVGSSNTTSGASLMGVYDEFDNSSSTTVQDVLDDLDAVITTLSGGTYTGWTLAGDSGSSQTISSGNTASIVGGTNGIDTVASATDTLTLNLDTTEIGTTTFGSGSGFTWTFNAGATDPTIAFASDAITFTAGTNTFSSAVAVNGNLTIGDASGDTLTANASTWTFANDTNFVLSGGVNGLSLDGTTFSVDATNDRIGIGTAAPSAMLSVGSSSQFQVNSSGNIASIGGAAHGISNSSGNLLLDSAGTKTIFAEDIQVNGNDILDSAANTRLTFSTNTLTLSNTTTVNLGTGVTLADGGDLTLDPAGGDVIIDGNLSMGYNNISWTARNATLGGGYWEADEIEIFASDLSITANTIVSGTLGATSIYSNSDIELTDDLIFTSDGEINVSGALNLVASNVGIRTSNPGAALEINHATGNNLRLTYNDSDGSATNFVDFITTSSGDLDIYPSGGDVSVSGSIGSSGLTVAGTTDINNVGSAVTNIGTSSTAGTVTVGGSGTQTINLGNGGGTKTVNLGSSTGSSVTAVHGTTLNINTGGSRPTNINTNSGGTVTISNNTGQVDIGTGNFTQTLNFGSGAGAKTITIGSTTGAGTTSIFSGSGGLSIGTSGGNISLGSGSNTFGINTSNWDISTAGVASGFTGITSTNTITGGSLAVSNDVNGILSLGRQDNTNEGGHLSLVGAGSYDGWHIDSYQNTLRLFTNTSSTNLVNIFNNGAGVASLDVEGYVEAKTGSNSAPSFTFDGDGNTGMYQNGADVIGFTAGGTNSVDVSTLGVRFKNTANGATCNASTVGTFTYDRDNATIGYLYLCREQASNGTYVWRQIDNTAMTNSSPDLAEYAWSSDLSLNGGDIVAVTNATEARSNFYDRFNIIRASQGASKKVLGVVSSDPGIVLNKPETEHSVLGEESAIDPHLKPLTLAGRVPVKVVTSGSLHQGDRIGLSEDLPGIGSRLIGSGFSVGTVLTSFNAETASCINISSMSQATWPNSNKDECYRLPDGRVLAKVLILVQNEYSLADSSLQEDGSFTVGGNAGNAFRVVDETGTETASISSAGDATFRSVIAQEMSSRFISAESMLVSGDATVEGTLSAQSARFDALNANGATVSGTIYADRLEGRISSESVEGLEDRIAALIAAQTASQSGTPQPDPETEGDIGTLGNGGSEEEAITLPGDLIVNGLIQANGGIATNTLLVDGLALTKDAFSFPTEAECSAETGCNVFAFQPSGVGTITFLNNLVVMSDGTVTINGDLAVTGAVTAGSVETTALASSGQDLTVNLSGTNSEGGDVLGKFIVNGAAEFESARFDTISVNAQTADADSSNEDQSAELNASSGTAVLKANKAEYKIRTTAAKANSLVYLTATSATENKVLFIKSQADGEFVVALDTSIGSDVTFNWWVVESNLAVTE